MSRHTQNTPRITQNLPMMGLLLALMLFVAACTDGAHHNLVDVNMGDTTPTAAVQQGARSGAVYTVELSWLEEGADSTFDAYRSERAELLRDFGARHMMTHERAASPFDSKKDTMLTADVVSLTRWPSQTSLERALAHDGYQALAGVRDFATVKAATIVLEREGSDRAIEMLSSTDPGDTVFMWSAVSFDTEDARLDYDKHFASIMEVGSEYGAQRVSSYRTIDTIEGDLKTDMIEVYSWPSHDAIEMFSIDARLLNKADCSSDSFSFRAEALMGRPSM